MLRFVSLRLLLLAATLWLVGAFIFIAGRVLPGDVGRVTLGPFADAAAVAALNHKLGADRPLLDQYWGWFSGALSGDFGFSIALQAPVGPYLLESILASARLGAFVFAIVVPLGLGLGVVAALKAGSWLDRAIIMSGVCLAIVPDFVSALAGLLVLGLWLHWFPLTGEAPTGSGLGVTLWHLFLPALPIVLNLVGYISRMTRAGTLAALKSDYTRTAVLKGMSPGIVLFRHVLPNALIPTVAVLATQTAYLMGGLLVVESLFGIKGLGSLVLAAAKARDFPMLQAGVLVMAAVLVGSTLVGELLQSVLDPRLRRPRSR